jgi:hypothetical protein
VLHFAFQQIATSWNAKARNDECVKMLFLLTVIMISYN